MPRFLKNNKQEIISSLIFLFFAFGFNIYRVQGDGCFYYAFLEHILHISRPEMAAQWAGKLFYFQSGCAFFNAPFYLAAYWIENLFKHSWNFNGITLRQVSINLASNFYMVLSIILCVKILKKIKFKYIVLPVTSVLFSTSAFASSVVMPAYNHAVNIFIITLFIYALITDEENNFAYSFWLGVIYIIAILVRYFNFILILPVIVCYLNKKDIRRLKFFFLGLIALAWIIPLIFYIYNGNALMPFRSGISGPISVSDVGISLIPKYFFKGLVHPLHGLFVWSPVSILSVIGLLLFPKAREKIGYIFLGTWLLFVILHGFLQDWHGGWGFSNRYLSDFFPVYVIGLAAFLERYGRKMVLPVITATLYSIFLFFNWYLCVINGFWGTPFNMLEFWLKGESPDFSGRKVNLSIFLRGIYELCRYKYLVSIIK